MNYLNAFLVGGMFCAIAEGIMLKTAITPARLLVIYVLAGVAMTVAGIYEPLVEFAGGGATVPLTGFGYALAEGVKKAVLEKGWIGIFSGGFTATASGIGAVLFFGYLAAIFSNPKIKK